jgi:DNA mismatch repair protein MutL
VEDYVVVAVVPVEWVIGVDKVRAETLSRALDDAYRATVPAGRYPPVALDVEIDPRKVDVNVHPTKQLVRFSDERGARRAVADAVKMAIEWSEQRSYQGDHARGSSAAPSGKPTAASVQGPYRTLPDHDPTPDRKKGTGQQEGGTLFDRHRGRPSRAELENAAKLPQFRRRIQDASRSPLDEGAEERARSDDLQQAAPARFSEAEPPERGELPALKELRVVGQVGMGYILLEEAGAV